MAVVTRALAKDPDARYQDLAGMRKDLVRLRQRIEAETPEPIAPPDGDAETILIQGQETPQSGQRPQGSRRGADRDELSRRRMVQVGAQLEVARQAMAAGEFDAAAAAAEQALMLNAEDATALEILDRARMALDERQVQQLLTRGDDLLRSGALTGALAVADEALGLMPDSSAVRAFRQSIDRARTDRQLALERAEALRAALQRAQKLFETGEFEQAEAAAADALQLDPELGVARALQQQARDAAQRAKQSAAALEAAQQTESHEAAVKILEEAHQRDRMHAQVGRQLERRRAAWQEEQRQARVRREKVAAAIAEAKAAPSHAAAIAALEAAQVLTPEDKDVGRLLTERRAALAREEEAARRAREREAAMAEADATPDHAAAVGILRRAVAIDEGHAGLREQLAVRERALERQEAELRQARERAAKVAAALTAAEQASSHEVAVTMLEGALRLDPAHAEVGRQLERRRAAWQEEQRQARERRENVAAAIAEAKAASSHAAAIAVLERVAALEPEDQDVGRLLAERRAALAKEEEAARRAREREAAIAAARATARQTPAHEAAIQILEGALTLDPSNADVQRDLGERRSARERELEEARLERDRRQLERERKENVAAALTKAKQTASHETAVKILEGARQLDPAHAEVGRQLERRRAAWQEEQRQARERREKVAAAIVEANAASSHAAAIAALERAQALGPEDKEVGRLLAERRAALAREEEAARRAREREAAIAAAMAEADATPDHAAAIGILRRAVAIDAGHAAVREQLAAREHAFERARKVAAALAAAQQAASHEAALKILEGAQQLDPAHTEVGRQLELRRAAWQEEQRQAHERREKAAAAVAEAQTATSHAVAIAALERAQAHVTRRTGKSGGCWRSGARR